jgi:hypothetical protein
MRIGLSAVLLAACLAVAPTEARAMLSGVCDGDLPGGCLTSVSFAGDTVTISLKNLSSSGYIVADAFNIGSAVVKLGTFTTSDADFKIAVLPFSSLDTLITINWFGGSTISDGIGAGGSAWFSFDVYGGYAGLDAKILDSMLVGFIGPRSIDIDQVNVKRVAMPEMSTLPLLVLGLGGLGVLWRRRASQDQ